MAEPFTVPAEGKDTIQTFVLPVSLPHVDVVKAIDFHPGNLRSVHHASFLIDTTGNARMLDEDHPEPGYPGMGDIGLNLAGSFGTWSPNSGGAVRFPDGIGRTIPKQCDLVVEMHFNPTGKLETIQPRVGLYFVKEDICHRAVNCSLGAFFLDIPADEKKYIITDSFTVPVKVQLLGIAPHAHYLCRQMHVTAKLPEGKTLALLTIKDWDFNWQQEFRFAEPLDLPAGTTLEMEFVYDNSAENPRNPNNPPQRVRIGSTAADEMALAFCTLVAADERERPQLEEAHKQKLLDRMKQAQIKRGQGK
jgi:hypothetical protein